MSYKSQRGGGGGGINACRSDLSNEVEKLQIRLSELEHGTPETGLSSGVRARPPDSPNHNGLGIILLFQNSTVRYLLKLKAA